jgi:alpha-amylase
MAYAFILTHPGYPCVFWKDYFEHGLGRPGSPRGIAALVAAHEASAGGDAIVRYVDDDLYVMERTGWQAARGWCSCSTTAAMAGD